MGSSRARLLNATHHDVAVDALLDQRLALDADDAVLLRVVDPVVRAAAQTKPNPPRCAAAGALNQPTDWHRCTMRKPYRQSAARPPAGRSRVTAPAPAAAVVLLRRCAVAGAVPGHARPVRPVRIIRCSWFVLTQISSSFTSYLCSATRFLPTQPSLVQSRLPSLSPASLPHGVSAQGIAVRDVNEQSAWGDSRAVCIL